MSVPKESGFGAPNQRALERAQLQRALERAVEEAERLRKENERLRNVLRQVRGALITRKHKAIIDRALPRRQ